VDYGWEIKAIGDSKCFVTAVRPENDAASKGLKPGDQLLSLNGVPLARQNLRYIECGYHIVPQSGLHLTVRSPGGGDTSIVAMAKVFPGQEMVRHSDVMEWLRRPHDQKDRSRYFRVSTATFEWPKERMPEID
jgi:hypothetical protein